MLRTSVCYIVDFCTYLSSLSTSFNFKGAHSGLEDGGFGGRRTNRKMELIIFAKLLPIRNFFNLIPPSHSLEGGKTDPSELFGKFFDFFK